MRDHREDDKVGPHSTGWPFPFDTGIVALEVRYALPDQRIWTAKTTSERGLPSIHDAPIWEALIKLWRQFGDQLPPDRSLKTTVGKIAQVLGNDAPARTDESIIGSLIQLKRVQIRLERRTDFSRRDVPDFSHFNLINRIETSTRLNSSETATVEVELSGTVVASATAGDFNLFDLGRRQA